MMRGKLKVKEVGFAELSAEECVAVHLIISNLLRLYSPGKSARGKLPIAHLPISKILGRI